MAEPKWLDEEEANAWRSLQMMNLRLSAALGRDLAAQSNLSQQDYLVLVVLTDRPDGTLRIFELGQELGWEKSRISHQVSRMVARGLLEKFVCSSDRRGQFVRVTPRGRAVIAAAAPSHVAAVRRFFVDRLSRDQLGHLASVAQVVLEALGEPGAACAD